VVVMEMVAYIDSTVVSLVMKFVRLDKVHM